MNEMRLFYEYTSNLTPYFKYICISPLEETSFFEQLYFIALLNAQRRVFEREGMICLHKIIYVSRLTKIVDLHPHELCYIVCQVGVLLTYVMHIIMTNIILIFYFICTTGASF